MTSKTKSTLVEVKLTGKKIFKEDCSQHWKDNSRRLWISSMFLGTMFLYSARSTVPLCMAAISKELSWDKFTDSAVMSAFFWGYTPGQIAGGYLSDRYGGELVLGFAGVLWSICTFVVPFLPAGPVLFFPPIVIIVLSRVLTGLSQGVHYPSLTSILVKRIPLKERSFLTGTVFSAGTVGVLLMGSAGSFILIYSGWQTVFIIQGSVSLLWALIWLHYSILKYSTKNQPEKSTTNSVNGKGPLHPIRNSSISVPYGLFFRNIGVWALIIGQFAQSGAFWNLFSWLPLYFEESFPGSKKWVYNVIPWTVTFPIAVVSGLVADHMTKSGFSVTFVRKLFQTISMLVPCLCMILFDWVTTFNQALCLVIITMLFCGMGQCGIPTAPQDMAPKFAGSLFGVMNAAGALSGIVIVPISGHLLEITHSWKSVFHINAVLLLVGSIVFLIFGTAKRIV